MLTDQKYQIYPTPDNKGLILTWGCAAEEGESEFSTVLDTFLIMLRQNRSNYAIIDYSGVSIIFSPMLRQWLSSNWIPRLAQNNQLKKLSFVLDQRLAHWTIQDLMHDAGNMKFKIAYFHQLKVAKTWLNA